MVFALLDDFVNLKNLHIQHDGKNSCHPQAAATCTYRRTLVAMLRLPYYRNSRCFSGFTPASRISDTTNIREKLTNKRVC